MKQLLGEDSSVVPVLANLPRETYRNRMVKKRQIRDTDADDSVKRMVGEAKKEEETIPDDAEEIDASELVVGKPLRQPKEVVQEPSHPSSDKEKYQSPVSALTAPDVTPQATQPIDPSQVPGTTGPERFTAADLDHAEPVAASNENTAAKAMDVLLGRGRASKPAANRAEFDQAGAVETTEEQAAAMLGIQTPLQEEAKARAANAMASSRDGAEMPPPTSSGDGAAIFSAFRRFNG